MRQDKSGGGLRAICKGTGCVIAVALVAFAAAGPAISGVLNVSAGEASISPSGGSGSSVPLGALAGLAELFSGDHASRTARRICTEAPEFAGTAASGDLIRPSRGRGASIRVSGAISLAEGCELRRLTYSVEDEHARFEGAAEARIADDGSFSIDVPLQGVSGNDASDMGGRQYTITLFAEDEAGVGASKAIDVMVSPDPRN